MRVTAKATAAASRAPTTETTAPSHAPNIKPARAKSGCVGTKGTREATATHDAIIAGPSGPERFTSHWTAPMALQPGRQPATARAPDDATTDLATAKAPNAKRKAAAWRYHW